MSFSLGRSARLLPLLVIVATTACSVQHRPKQQYAGQLKSEMSACPTTQGTLIIQNAKVVFSPTDGIWTLQGEAHDGHIDASHDRPGVDHKVFATKLTATVTEAKVVGTYTTPSCTYAVDLSRF